MGLWAIFVSLSSASHLTAFPGPCDRPVPKVSILNFLPGEARPNTVVIAIGSDRTICLVASSTMHLVVDTFGYFL